MPASSNEGIGNVVAALESNFKQQQRRLINSETFIPDNNLASADKEDENVTDSWIDQILGNEIFYNESTDYTSQNGKPFGKCSIPGLHHLKKEMAMACEKNLASSIIRKCDKQAMAGSKLLSGSPTKKEDQLEEPRRILYNKEKIQLGWVNPPLHRSGMFNLGNTCYLNSSLQALFHIPAFANWLMEESLSHLHSCSQNAMNASFCSLCAMIKTHKVATESNQGAIRPHLIVNKLKCIGKMFTNGRQEDAHEFLKLLLDHMERSYLQFRGATKLDHLSRQTTPLNQIFGGYLRQQVSCPSCQYVSTTFSHFQDLVLDIRASSSLDQALEHYFRTETLDAANCYKCERCKKKVPATKRSLIERPPNVLLIQLKRFTFNGGKIGKHINIQRFLNLSRFVNGCQRKGNKSNGTMNGGNGFKMNSSNNGSWSNGQSSDDESDGAMYKYRLVSMVVHLGGSQHGGHYIACAEGGNGTMYEFDDCSVRNVGLQSVLLRNPYILFYELSKRPSSTPTKVSVKQLNKVGLVDCPHSPLMRQNSDKFLIKPSAGLASSPGLFRQNSDNRLMHHRVSGLSNGSSSKEDLGEVVKTRPLAPLQQKHAMPGLPLAKDRERITFDVKSPHFIKSISSTNDVRTKIIMRTNVSLLNSSLASPSTSSTNTSSVAPPPTTAKVIHSTTTNAISIGKLGSVAYLLDQKKAEQKQPTISNGYSSSNKGSSSNSLVPYASDTESSDDDVGSSPIKSLGNDSSKSSSNGSVSINGCSVNGSATNTISTANRKTIMPLTQFKPRQIIVNKINNINGTIKSPCDFKEPTSISIIRRTELQKNSPSQAGTSNSDLGVDGNDCGAAGGSTSPQKAFISCDNEDKKALNGNHIKTTTLTNGDWKVNKRKTELAKSRSEDSGVKPVSTYVGIGNNVAKVDGSCDSRSLQSCHSSNLSEKTVSSKGSSVKSLLSFISCLSGAQSPATTPDGDDKKELLRNGDVSIINGKTKSPKKLKSQAPKAQDGIAAPKAGDEGGVLPKRSREEEKEQQQRKGTNSKKCRSEKFFKNMVNGKLCSNGAEGTSSDNSPVINGKCDGHNPGASSRTVSRDGLNGSCGRDASDDGINSIKKGNFSRDDCGKKHKTKNITNGHCGMANGGEDSSNDSDDDHNSNHSFNNSCLNGDSNRRKVNDKYNPDHRNGNKRTNSDDDSDSRDDSSEDKCVKKVAPVTMEVAYDKHTRGDLQYNLSSHKKQRLQLNGSAESVVGQQQKGGNALMWPSENVTPGTDPVHQLQHSTSFAFGRQGDRVVAR